MDSQESCEEKSNSSLAHENELIMEEELDSYNYDSVDV